MAALKKRNRGKRAEKAGVAAGGAIVIAFVLLVLIMGNIQPIMFVPTTSMQPTIPRGSVILVKSVPSSSLQVGDIIVFSVPKAYQVQYDYPPTIVHRIISMTTGSNGVTMIQTKGDNTAEDPFQITPSQVRGEVVTIIPYLGFPLMYLDSIYGIASLIIIVSYFWLPGYIESYDRKRKEGKKQQDERLINIERSVDSFSRAINEYAKHLESHTAVIKELKETTETLSNATAKMDSLLDDHLRLERKRPFDWRDMQDN